MSDITNPGVQGAKVPRMLVMGVGGSGVLAVEALLQLDPELTAVGVDTDTKALNSKVLTNHGIHVGQAVTNGLSAGGDVELGRQAIEKNSSDIRRQLREVDLLVIVAGLGGGTGSGAVPVVTRLAREAGALVMCMVSMPFKFEGRKILNVAEEALKRIRTHADAIVRIPNERLIERSDADLSAAEAFSRSHQIMLDGVFSLMRMLSQRGICGLDFAGIHTMLRNCDGYCNFASSEASGSSRATAVAEGVVQHQLLNKGKLLASAAGAVVGITGGSDLRLSEIEEIMDKIHEKLPENVWVNYGVAIDPAFEGRLSAFVLAAEQWREALVDASRQSSLFTGRPMQGELQLEASGKGCFSHLDPTIHANQDLDVPTYIRRNIKLPR
jgi:cell division protein FtsZ